MLACGHERERFGSPLCPHLRACRQPGLEYVRWYTGSGLDAELLCVPCADARDNAQQTSAEPVCEECFDYATTEIGDLVGVRGKAEIRTRDAPLNTALKTTALPTEIGTIVDVAPIDGVQSSLWLLLTEGGLLIRLDADTLEWAGVAVSSVPREPALKAGNGAAPGWRLHASRGGQFAAVVNDYGRHGQLIDLRHGGITLELDGGDYHADTVPFSFAFVEMRGRVFVIHRTDWNRLDVSDAATGTLLSERGPTSYRSGEERPAHYLDYFHGALSVSPNCTHILSDGWVWHPVGIPVTWNVERWISDNVWESEDGPTRLALCDRDYYWNSGVAWIAESTVAIGGIGEDDMYMIDGARIFDVTAPGSSHGQWHRARELRAFAGPAGEFFSDGVWLYSAGRTGLSRWSLDDGARTGHLPEFCPTHYHRGARELVHLVDGMLVRWSSSS